MRAVKMCDYVIRLLFFCHTKEAKKREKKAIVGSDLEIVLNFRGCDGFFCFPGAGGRTLSLCHSVELN